MRSVLLAAMCVLATSCGTLRALSTTGPGCAAPDPDDGSEPLYAEARDLLMSPTWAKLRAEHSLQGRPSDVRWLTDDAICNHIRQTLRLQDDDPAIGAVWAGNLILVSVRSSGGSYLFDRSGKLLTGFVVPD